MKKFLQAIKNKILSIRLIKLHVGLFRYIKIELKNKKTKKELVTFFGTVTKAYFGELLRLVKVPLVVLFDKEYKKQKKEFKRINELKRDLKKALHILKVVDKRMAERGDPKWKRKQFWRDFYKNAEARQELFNDIEKELK